MNCKQCNTAFVAARHWQEFCSKDCRTAYHQAAAKQGGVPAYKLVVGENLDRLIAMHSTTELGAVTHCGYCGNVLGGGRYQGFCNSGCFKHFVLKDKVPVAGIKYGLE